MFRFRLQRVLDFREKQLDARKLELRRAEQRVLEAAAALDGLRRRRAELDAEAQQPAARALGPIELQTGLLQLRSLIAREEGLRAELAARVGERERARKVVLAAHQKVKSLHRLRERRGEEYELELRAQERRQMDDISGRNGEKSRARTASPARRGR